MNIEKLYNLSAPVLITGETGTGKSWLAGIIHKNSKKQEMPFITVHLASITETLFESELFGHVRGSFTGAIADKRGHCEMVGQGTLFLDEIGELSIEMQKKLLFLLEEKVFYSVGSCLKKKFRGRIIAATNRDLARMVKKGEFRSDLYYRLMIFNHQIKPLRADTVRLRQVVASYLEKYEDEYERPGLEITNECHQFLIKHSWPGNIREVKNCMEYIVCCSQDKVEIDDLPDWILKNNQSLNQITEGGLKYSLDYHQALDNFENDFFCQVLEYFGGRVNHTARELGISKSTLIAKIRKYGINIWKIKAKRKDLDLLNIHKIA